jgi:lipopolysaccharide biosynthesis protein
VLRSLYNDTGAGIMLPESYIYHLAPNRYNSQRNMESVRRMAEIMGVETSEGQHVFPAGSMFWARTEAIMPMHEILDIKSGRHFPAESGQLDETFAHCCERLFSISAESVGLDTVDSADPTLFWADKYSGIPWK